MGHVKLRWRGDAGKPTEATSLATTPSNMTAMMEFAFKMGQQQCQSISSAASGPSRKPILALEDKKPGTEELEASHQQNCFWEEANCFYCVCYKSFQNPTKGVVG